MVERRTFDGRDRGSKSAVVEHRTFRSEGPGFKVSCGRASDFSVGGAGVQSQLW